MAGSGTQQSIFEQIATSVSKAKVVVACVSQEKVSKLQVDNQPLIG